jgi:RNA ligase (TIGR02306 family)
VGFEVKVVEIDDIGIHPNADKLDMATVGGWACVVARGMYKKGDKAIYIPIDSILPEELESKIFGDAKVKLHNHRVKTIKIRGAISQGLVISLAIAGLPDSIKVGVDVAEKLGIKKHEPPAPRFHPQQKSSPSKSNPNFHKYAGIENIKNHTKLFQDDDEVVVSEKIHGTNFRAGWVEFSADTWWKKFKKMIGLAPKWEFVYGSHNVQLSNKLIYSGYYDTNVYAEAVVKYKLKETLKPGEVIYGEIYGDSIQKGYTYGCKKGERKFVAFDLRYMGKFLSYPALYGFCFARDIPAAPILFQGKFSDLKLDGLILGNSVLAPEQKVREGVVVKSRFESTSYIGRKIVKVISPEYLLKDQTDFH